MQLCIGYCTVVLAGSIVPYCTIVCSWVEWSGVEIVAANDTLYSCKVVFWTQKSLPDCLMSNAQSFHGSCLRSVAHSLAVTCVFWECVNPPHIHPMFRYVITCDQVYKAFPHVSTVSNKHWGEKAWVWGYKERPIPTFWNVHTSRTRIHNSIHNLN